MSELKQLLKVLDKKEVWGSVDIRVEGIAYDSRQVKPGFIFVAINGYREDGNKYIPDALKAGAKVIVSTKRTEQLGCVNKRRSVTQVIVDDPRRALAILSTAFYGYPSDNLNIVGITGTNGKTTTSYLTESILKQKGERVAVLGTIAYRFGEEILPAPVTTPQSSDLQRILKKLVDMSFTTVVMEVSSHALSLARVEGCEFDTAIFTNISREHLDFHNSMEEYLEAKIKLFSQLGVGARKKNEKVAIVNRDDPRADQVIKSTRAKVVTYAIENEADVIAEKIKLNHTNTLFVLRYGKEEEKISLPLIGRYNVYNALAASSVALTRGIDLGLVKRGLENVLSIPGRFEKIDCGQPFTVIVDYAHTDEALRKLLLACRELKPRRIITVFGCGGDRDRGKRPLMGEVAVELSDYVIVTSDNPRSEEPERIALDIEVGIKRKGKDNYETVLDREEAIRRALRLAEEKDMVVLAGKGHENYQILKDKRIQFDDREVARNILSQMGYGEAGNSSHQTTSRYFNGKNHNKGSSAGNSRSTSDRK